MGNWLLESHGVEVKDMYFNEKIDEWKHVLWHEPDAFFLYNYEEQFIAAVATATDSVGEFIPGSDRTRFDLDGNDRTPIDTDGYNDGWSNWQVTSITFKSNITSLGDGAFYGCRGLTEIVIPASVTSLGSKTFATDPNGWATSKLVSVTFEPGTTIETLPGDADAETGVFGGGRFTSFDIPDSVTTIGPYAFSKCSALTSIVIPDSVTTIEKAAFNECSALKSIEIPDSITTIPEKAFSNCTALTEIVIPASVTTIADNAFQLCTSLTEIVIPASVTTIGDRVFSNCSALKSVTFEPGSKLESIGKFDQPHKRRKDMTHWRLGGVPGYASGAHWMQRTWQSDRLFYINTAESSNVDIDSGIVIPIETPSSAYGASTVEPYFAERGWDWLDVGFREEIWPNGKATAFQYANQIESIWVHIGERRSQLVHLDPAAAALAASWPTDAKKLRNVMGGDVISVSSNESTGVRSPFKAYVGHKGNFSDIVAEARHTLPDGTHGEPFIPQADGYGTYSTPDGVEYQEPWFHEKISDVLFYPNITSIGFSALSFCNALVSITIPASVTSIGSYAFAYSASLRTVEFEAESSLTTIGANAFKDCVALGSIVIPDSVTTIGSFCCSGCWALTNVVLSASFTGTLNNTFGSCASLESIEIPASVTTLDATFYGCLKLATVTFATGSKLTTIGQDAFRTCRDLTSITIPDSVTSIGDGVFRDCRNLTSVVIPDSVTSIGDGAFQSCTSLTSVVIPNSVTSIGESAFEQCESLTSVVIGNKVESIGNSAFVNCDKLTSVVIPNTVTSIGGGVFTNTTCMVVCINNEIAIPSSSRIIRLSDGLPPSDTDLSGVNLSGINLSGVNLSGVNLSAANLYGATTANIIGVPTISNNYVLFPESTNQSTNQSTNIIGPGVHLPGADISGANLSGANLSDINFSNTNMFNELGELSVQFGNNNLTGATLGPLNWTTKKRAFGYCNTS